jgi:hypothetical protein
MRDCEMWGVYKVVDGQDIGWVMNQVDRFESVRVLLRLH